MKYLYQLLIKFYQKFRTNNKTQYQSESELKSDYFGGICFFLNKSNDVEITTFLPDTELIDEKNIIEISEKYAQLLLAINYGFLKERSLDVLLTKSENSNDHREQLLIDNIITFYDIFKNELSKIQTNSKFPLIRPTSVFKNK